MHQFLYGTFPYIALTVLAIGSIARYERELGIPATDALTRSPECLVEMVLSAFPELEEKLHAGAL